MADFRQHADGSVAVQRETDSMNPFRAGGKMGAAAQTGPDGNTIPAYIPGSQMVFNITSTTDTPGGLLSWQNLSGFDIIVKNAVLDITAVSNTSASASFGSSTNSTGLSANMLSAKDIHSTATLNGGALSVRVSASNWITGGVSSGTSSSFSGRVAFEFFPIPATGNG